MLTIRTGDYNRYVSRYVALDWTIGRDEPGQIKMDGWGSLCLDAGNSESYPFLRRQSNHSQTEPKAGKTVQVWECSSSRAAAQTWVFAENQLRLGDTQLCIEVRDGEHAAGEAHEGNIRLAECRSSRFGQWWRLKDPSRSFTVQGPLWV